MRICSRPAVVLVLLRYDTSFGAPERPAEPSEPKVGLLLYLGNGAGQVS